MWPEPYALFTQLLRRSGNNTGEIADDKWTPRLAKLASDAKMSRASGHRALADLREYGWFVRYEIDDPGKVAGLLCKGRDFPVPVCQRDGCGKPLMGMRSDARYCSDRYRQAARRDSARSQEPGQPGSRAVSRAVTVSRLISVTVTDDPGQASLRSRDNPQVTGVETGRRPHRDLRREREVESQPANDLELCAVCGTSMDPVLPAIGYRTHPNCERDEEQR
jgi:hypothetical protein